MDIPELHRLNGGSFEQLVRALAFATFGPSGSVYSQGADAGRDFTITGPIPGYELRNWDGYLVVQAKFRESQGSESDPDWLMKQLSDEMNRYRNDKAGRRTPEYLIIATNVPLSGADGKTKSGKPRVGGLSKIQSALNNWCLELGIKGFDVWSRDKIASLLSAHTEVRRTFAAWVTPGDVLAEVLSSLETKRADFGRVIRRGVVNSLRRNQHTPLKDAGSVTDQQIRTSQVFIDVPFMALSEDEHIYPRMRSESEPLVIAELVERAKFRLDPTSLTGRRRPQTGRRLPGNRIVLLGGPGQGKSTASTFLSQLFRAALILADPISRQDDVAAELAPEILARAAAEGVSGGIPRRFPVLISLPEFADKISAAKSSRDALPTLLGFIASEIADAGDGHVDRDDLRSWFSQYPLLVVLDGLDEVPPSGERSSIIDAISSIMTEFNESKADVLVIVTSRPQGYNSDLDPNYWEHWELINLPIERGLAYAKALGEARYPDDKRRRDLVYRSLSTASVEAATARLMVSPLQITILYLVVDTGGSAPAARWTLFSEYYEILRKRERAKGGHVQAVLERNVQFIGPIHQRAGLILQALSEVSGSAQANLSRDGFETLVSSYLEQHGFKSEDLAARTEELTELALNRLVLLSAREEGAIRFDVRSLQEFMAAAALTSGDDRQVEARLAHLSGIAHWRHAFLIAASRCFAEDAFHHRRSAVVNVARALETSVADGAVRNGARLAAEMFEDGIAADYPVLRRVLARHSLELLSAEMSVPYTTLGKLWDPAVEDLIIEGIRTAIRTPRRTSARHAWRLLFDLSQRLPAALKLLREEWPTHSDLAIELVSDLPDYPARQEYERWLKEVLFSLPADEAFLFTRQRDGPRHGSQWLGLSFPSLVELRAPALSLKLSTIKNIAISIRSISSETYYSALLKDLDQYDSREALQGICELGINPSKEALAGALRSVAGKNISRARELSAFAPWPLVALTEAAAGPLELLEFAKLAAEGAFGDTTEWKAAEARWTEHGISEEDIASAGEFALGPEIHRIGSPPLGGLIIRHDGKFEHSAMEIVQIGLKASWPPHKAHLAEALSYIISPYSSGKIHDAENACSVLDFLIDSHSGAIDIGILDSVWEVASDPRVAHEISRLASCHIEAESGASTVSAQMVLDLFGNYPENRGLLTMLIYVRAAEEESTPLSCAKDMSHAFQPRRDDPPHIRLSAMCLASEFDIGGDLDLEEIALELGSLLEIWPAGRYSDFLDAILNSLLLDDESWIHVLLRVLAEVGGKPDQEYTTRNNIKYLLDRRKSGLLDQAVWQDKLELPADAMRAVPM